MKRHATPIIAAVLLLLPVLYVGSYLALVKPYTGFYFYETADLTNYRWGGNWAGRIFWPLEQIDRKVRPGAWETNWDNG